MIFDIFFEIMDVLKQLVQLYPEALQQMDGRSKLPPFLQATAAAAEASRHNTASATTRPQEELSLSITFKLLREDPASLLCAKGG